MTLKQPGPFRRGLFHELGAEDCAEFFPVVEPVLKRPEPGVVGQLGPPHSFGEYGVELVLQAGDVYPPIFRPEHLGRDERGMGAVGEFGRLKAAVHDPGGLVGELRGGAVHQGNIHVAALPRPLGLPQGGQHTRHREEAPRIIYKG